MGKSCLFFTFELSTNIYPSHPCDKFIIISLCKNSKLKLMLSNCQSSDLNEDYLKCKAYIVDPPIK